ncbi:hypothetical protein B0H11DRAFT_1931260 [Mycena galericulata]|nr:hypothetical protein B0H11DRAFT_1931260 [Mycena galericulata]
MSNTIRGVGQSLPEPTIMPSQMMSSSLRLSSYLGYARESMCGGGTRQRHLADEELVVVLRRTHARNMEARNLKPMMETMMIERSEEDAQADLLTREIVDLLRDVPVRIQLEDVSDLVGHEVGVDLGRDAASRSSDTTGFLHVAREVVNKRKRRMWALGDADPAEGLPGGTEICDVKGESVRGADVDEALGTGDVEDDSRNDLPQPAFPFSSTAAAQAPRSREALPDFLHLREERRNVNEQLGLLLVGDAFRFWLWLRSRALYFGFGLQLELGQRGSAAGYGGAANGSPPAPDWNGNASRWRADLLTFTSVLEPREACDIALPGWRKATGVPSGTSSESTSDSESDEESESEAEAENMDEKKIWKHSQKKERKKEPDSPAFPAVLGPAPYTSPKLDLAIRCCIPCPTTDFVAVARRHGEPCEIWKSSGAPAVQLARRTHGSRVKLIDIETSYMATFAALFAYASPRCSTQLPKPAVFVHALGRQTQSPPPAGNLRPSQAAYPWSSATEPALNLCAASAWPMSSASRHERRVGPQTVPLWGIAPKQLSPPCTATTAGNARGLLLIPFEFVSISGGGAWGIGANKRAKAPASPARAVTRRDLMSPVKGLDSTARERRRRTTATQLKDVDRVFVHGEKKSAKVLTNPRRHEDRRSCSFPEYVLEELERAAAMGHQMKRLAYQHQMCAAAPGGGRDGSRASGAQVQNQGPGTERSHSGQFGFLYTIIRLWGRWRGVGYRGGEDNLFFEPAPRAGALPATEALQERGVCGEPRARGADRGGRVRRRTRNWYSHGIEKQFRGLEVDHDTAIIQKGDQLHAGAAQEWEKTMSLKIPERTS